MKSFSQVKAGDIVLIESENQKRLDWPMARVICIILGHDGVPCIVKLKAATGELVHPLQRLIVLEASAVDGNNQKESMKQISTESADHHDIIDENQEETVIDNRQERKLTEIDVHPAEQIKKHTRSGRLVKIPSKYSQDL